jgi:hypothetical protein
MTVRFTLTEMVDMAGKAKQPIDQFIRSAQVYEEHQAKLDADRRANPETKAAISEYLNSLDGTLTPDLSRSEICANAGVPFNQGNSGFARREIVRILQLRDMRGKH